MGKFCVAISICLLIVSVVHARRLEEQHGYHQRSSFENEMVDHAPTGALARVIAKEVPKSVTSFSVHLVRKLVQHKPVGNIFFSPMNIYAALIMHMHTVSTEHVSEELRKAMKMSNTENDNGKLFESAFEELWRRFEHHEYHDASSHSETQTSERLATTYGIFVQSDNAVINALYKSLQNKHYPNATYTHVDFHRHAEEAESLINAFIAKHTEHHRIEKFYDQIASTTKGILINTVQFSGHWQNTFHAEHTQVERFQTMDSDAIEVSMMHNQADISYTFSDVLQFDAIELQCEGGELSMYVVLPRPHQTIQNMTEHGHLYDPTELKHNARVVSVDYKIPKMKFSMTNSLVEPLGLNNVFEYVDHLRHHADVHLDEHGVQAVAATGVGNEHQHTSSETPTHSDLHPVTAEHAGADVKFYVNRPFSVIVFHKPTNVIMFHGVVHRPHWTE